MLKRAIVGQDGTYNAEGGTNAQKGQNLLKRYKKLEELVSHQFNWEIPSMAEPNEDDLSDEERPVVVLT